MLNEGYMATAFISHITPAPRHNYMHQDMLISVCLNLYMRPIYASHIAHFPFIPCVNLSAANGGPRYCVLHLATD